MWVCRLLLHVVCRPIRSCYNRHMLTICLFGAPEIVAQEQPLPLTNQKARALLFYLALTGQPHTRSHLATLLWSEYPGENGRRSLRSALFQLRRALRTVHLEQAIEAEGDLLHFDAGHVNCDVTEFCRLLARNDRASLAQAVALYRGPLLEGFTLPDAPLFDEWLRLEEEKLAQAYLAALKRLADMSAAQQKWEESLAYLQRLVQIDPLAEEVQQQLIGHYLQQGDVNKALRQYRQFAAELRENLGVSPTPATESLYQEALRRQTQPSSPTASYPLPFVGRDELLARLLTLSRRIKSSRGHTSGRGHTVILQGDGGLGKTRLLQEFLDRLGQDGDDGQEWLRLQAVCSPFDDLISYGPFLEAFQETPLGDLTDQLLAIKEDLPAGRDQFIYRILQTVRRLSRQSPLVLAIDDLQWANRSTLNLFGLLATRLHHLPLLLLGTAQRPETIPALQRLVTVERRHGRLDLLTLSPLTETAVTDLLQNLAIHPDTIPPLVKWLQERSGGNPFVLDEMLTQLRADEILLPVAGQWQLDPGRWLRWRTSFTLPETSGDLVAWRLRHLSVKAHTLLEILAVAGQPLPFALLSDWPDFAGEELLPLIDDLLARGLLLESEPESFTLAHDLLRQTILHRLTHVRRRQLHGKLARKLAQCPAVTANFPLWEVARHAVAGEDVALARQYGLQILPKLPQAYTGAASVDFLRHLYDLLEPTAVPNEQMHLARVLGNVHHSLGHLSEALHWQQRYLALAQQAGDLAAQVTAYFDQGDVFLVSNDYLAATTSAEAGLAACGQLPPDDPAFSRLSGRGHRLLGHALAMEGRDLHAAERHLQEATAVHRLAGNRRDLCASLFELGNVAAQRGELRRALAFYEEAAAAAATAQAHYMYALAYNNHAYHSLLLGQLGAARQSLAQGQALAESYELLGALLHLASTQGEVHLYLAEWEEARQSFRRGLALAEELGNPERQAGYRGGLALAARGEGDLVQAIALLEEALLLMDGRGYWHLRARLLLWLAETFLQDGHLEAAQSHLDQALETAEINGRVLLHLQAQRLQASLLAARGKSEAAAASFAQTLAQALSLDLPLEIGRIQAAWGRSLPHSPQSRHLLAQARQIFTSRQAHADLAHSQM
jgi:DNA-binding SARP family transcriptional activator/predicted ATPase